MEELGFCWDIKERNWEKAFEKLRLYAKQNGNCDVPKKYEDDPALGQWVGVQRRSKKNDKLSAERTQKLNDFGFKWSKRLPSNRAKCDISTFYFDGTPVITYAGGYDKIKQGRALGEAQAEEFSRRGSALGIPDLLEGLASRVGTCLQDVYNDFNPK